METCDQITIECNRSQAVIADNTTNSSWVNSTPSIILEPGDTIECVGSWISVKNAGDDSIQVVNLTDPDQNLDISFKFSFYKSLNGQNIVTYPVNSFAWTRENTYPQSLIMYGFASDPNATGANEYGLSNLVFLPKINGVVDNTNPYVNNTYDDDNLAIYATYDSLINEQDADVYNKATDGLGYLAFLQNVGTKQGVRDLAGNNERYTAVYKKSNTNYEIYTHTVNASFSPQYASPVNIASFITESMNQTKALKTAYPDTTPIKEAWTNSLRYFRTIEPYAVPSVNLSTVPSGFYTSGSSATDGVPTIASYGSISHDCPSQTGLCIDFTLTVTQITYQNPSIVNLTIDNRCRLRGTYAPKNAEEARQFNYLYHIVQSYSGNHPDSKFYNANQDQINYMYKVYTNSGTSYGQFNPGTDQLNTGYKPGDPNTLNGYTVYNLAFHCPEIDCFQIAVSNQGEKTFQGQYPSGSGFPLTVGGALYGCMAKFDTQVPFPNSGSGTQNLAITNPITFDPNTGDWGTYTMEMFLLDVNNDLGIPSNAGKMTPGSNPDGIPLRLSVGGNPMTAGYKTADPLPMGVPLWVGADATTYPGSPAYNTQDDSDYPTGEQVKDAQRFTQSATEYAWCPYVLNLPNTGASVQKGKLNTYNETQGTTDDGTQFKFNQSPYINERFLEYTNGNKLLGCTSLNHNRWSLMNYDKPPANDDPENDVNFQPTMVKFPHFFSTGSRLWNPTTKKMMNVDRTLSTVKFAPLLQRGNIIVEEVRYNTVEEAQARTELWRNFIKGQIADGMIDQKEGTTTLEAYGTREVFPAYSHIVLELGANVYNADGSVGSDYAWRQRPRGFLIAVDVASFSQKAPIQSTAIPNSNRYYSGGVKYVYDPTANNYYIEIDGWSWIFDKSFEGIFANGETTTGYPTSKNFGFIDMNVVKNDYQTNDTLNIYLKANIKDSSGNINKLQDAYPDPSGNLINYCFGWSDMCSGWKNHIGYLSTTTLRNPDDYKFMFNYTTNRQSSNYQSRSLATGSGTNRLFPFGTGDVEYANRVALGCRQPLLSFGTDGNSRFFFSQLFQPIQVQNTFRSGTNISSSPNVVSTCQDGIYNLVDLPNDGYQVDTDASGNPVTSITVADEENAGSDAVFYQRRLWNTFLDGFPIFACEFAKHYPCYWKQRGGSGNNDDSARKCGNHLGLETFETNFPILDDEVWTTRFFMFPQQARINSFQNQLLTTERYVESKKQVGSSLVNRSLTFLSPERNYPTAFWGCLAGDRIPYVNNKREVGKENQVREFQNGTDCPQADKIYDVQTGVFLSDFIKWDESNWSESLWETMGYSYEDLNASQWVGIRNQRNFTKNFLQPSITDNYAVGVFHSQSYPVTTNASLSSAGFIPNTSNLIGELNATLNTPPNSLFFTGNIQSQDYNSYTVTSLTQSNSTQPGQGIVVFNRTGGSNQINNELFFYEFFNLKIDTTQPYGSYVLASSVPSKLEVPFYLVKTDLIENNYSYVNDCNLPANLPVCGCIGLQYSNTSDWYYSTNQLDTVFTNKKKRVVTSVRVELVDSNMNLASTLLDKSSVFFRITRADPQPFTMRDPENLLLLEEEMKKEDKKGYKEYQEEIDAYLDILDDK